MEHLQKAAILRAFERPNREPLGNVRPWSRDAPEKSIETKWAVALTVPIWYMVGQRREAARAFPHNTIQAKGGTNQCCVVEQFWLRRLLCC